MKFFSCFMPNISSFYGIIVYMYYNDNKQHHAPHIHAQYQNEEIIVKIPDGEILDGKFPPAKLKILLAWIEIHKDELVADWQLAIKGEALYKIDPLK
jgi:desulfoferrodoxin (superoxide reductase-like protein)